MLSALYLYLVTLAFSLVYAILYSRFVFQLLRAPFINPIAQWVYTSTNPLLRPLERVVPRWRQASLSALLLMFPVAILKLLLLKGLAALSAFGLLLALVDVLSFILWYWIWAVIGYVALSWLFSLVEARRGNPLVELVFLIGVQPCRLVQRLVPTKLGPFDFAPVIAILVLSLLDFALQGMVASASTPVLG